MIRSPLRFQSSPALLCVLVALLCCALGPIVVGAQKPACPYTGAFDPTRDYFPDKAAPLMSQFWNITYTKSYKLLQNYKAGTNYVLYPCGTPKPELASLSPNTTFYEVPAYFTGTASRTAIRFLERLGLRTQIKFVPATSLVTSPCLSLLAEQDQVRSIYPGFDVKEANVDVLFARQADGGTSEVLADVLQQSVLLSTYYESVPLEKLEWIKFISAFFNLEARANTIFQSVQQVLQCNAAALAQANLTAATGVVGRVSNIAWVGKNADGTYSTQEYGYKVKMVQDAGASPFPYVAPDTGAGIPSYLSKVDLLIDDTESNVETLNDLLQVYNLTSPTVESTYAFVRQRMAFRLDGRRKAGASPLDEFQQSYWAMPDHIQQDVINMVYPFYNPNWTRMWTRNVALGETYSVINSTQCPNGDPSSDFDLSYQRVTCPSQSGLRAGQPGPGSLGAGASSGNGQSSTSATDGSSKSGLPTGAVIGIIAGSLGIVLLSVVGIAVWYRARGQRGAVEDHLRGMGIVFSRGPTSESRRPAVVALGGKSDERREWLRLEEMMGDVDEAPLRGRDSGDLR
ncbi:hypothetical protein M427DRAFT_159527 [Gonapodya prolifera JEL478]|uniref:Periplasmic binding protein-like II n=1 Tax=Gonapodya prolifera (strain JEL478) TaxID=1344416 RepID=A0A139A0R2_GONPJ|nr:hypothetical protein M427DRAFT_159527 [Gonapodya prolifera JEL478]|eukprot:KXS10359.1 hypothetical protein M427DRAFT_159527 [Gonapodya prolifera JEL478]